MTRLILITILWCIELIAVICIIGVPLAAVAASDTTPQRIMSVTLLLLAVTICAGLVIWLCEEIKREVDKEYR